MDGRAEFTVTILPLYLNFREFGGNIPYFPFELPFCKRFLIFNVHSFIQHTFLEPLSCVRGVCMHVMCVPECMSVSEVCATVYLCARVCACVCVSMVCVCVHVEDGRRA